jgi:hypothetical protein
VCASAGEGEASFATRGGVSNTPTDRAGVLASLGLRSFAMMHKRIFGPELLIWTPVFLVQYTTFGETIRKGEAMWRRNWWRSNSRGRASGYGGTVKMAVGALVTVVLVLVVLQLLGLT